MQKNSLPLKKRTPFLQKNSTKFKKTRFFSGEGDLPSLEQITELRRSESSSLDLGETQINLSGSAQVSSIGGNLVVLSTPAESHTSVQTDSSEAISRNEGGVQVDSSFVETFFQNELIAFFTIFALTLDQNLRSFYESSVLGNCLKVLLEKKLSPDNVVPLPVASNSTSSNESDESLNLQTISLEKVEKILKSLSQRNFGAVNFDFRDLLSEWEFQFDYARGTSENFIQESISVKNKTTGQEGLFKFNHEKYVNGEWKITQKQLGNKLFAHNLSPISLNDRLIVMMNSANSYLPEKSMGSSNLPSGQQQTPFPAPPPRKQKQRPLQKASPKGLVVGKASQNLSAGENPSISYSGPTGSVVPEGATAVGASVATKRRGLIPFKAFFKFMKSERKTTASKDSATGGEQNLEQQSSLEEKPKKRTLYSLVTGKTQSEITSKTKTILKTVKKTLQDYQKSKNTLGRLHPGRELLVNEPENRELRLSTSVENVKYLRKPSVDNLLLTLQELLSSKSVQLQEKIYKNLTPRVKSYREAVQKFGNELIAFSVDNSNLQAAEKNKGKGLEQQFNAALQAFEARKISFDEAHTLAYTERASLTQDAKKVITDLVLSPIPPEKKGKKSKKGKKGNQKSEITTKKTAPPSSESELSSRKSSGDKQVGRESQSEIQVEGDNELESSKADTESESEMSESVIDECAISESPNMTPNAWNTLEKDLKNHFTSAPYNLSTDLYEELRGRTSSLRAEGSRPVQGAYEIESAARDTEMMNLFKELCWNQRFSDAQRSYIVARDYADRQTGITDVETRLVWDLVKEEDKTIVRELAKTLVQLDLSSDQLLTRVKKLLKENNVLKLLLSFSYRGIDDKPLQLIEIFDYLFRATDGCREELLGFKMDEDKISLWSPPRVVHYLKLYQPTEKYNFLARDVIVDPTPEQLRESKQNVVFQVHHFRPRGDGGATTGLNGRAYSPRFHAFMHIITGWDRRFGRGLPDTKSNEAMSAIVSAENDSQILDFD